MAKNVTPVNGDFCMLINGDSLKEETWQSISIQTCCLTEWRARHCGCLYLRVVTSPHELKSKVRQRCTDRKSQTKFNDVHNISNGSTDRKRPMPCWPNGHTGYSTTPNNVGPLGILWAYAKKRCMRNNYDTTSAGGRAFSDVRVIGPEPKGYSSPEQVISELRGVTCRMRSHRVMAYTCTFHPTQVNVPRLTPARQADIRLRFTYPGGMEGWVDLVVVYVYRDCLPVSSRHHPSK